MQPGSYSAPVTPQAAVKAAKTVKAAASASAGALPVYRSVHITAESVVDTFNGVEAKYDTLPVTDTKLTTDEFIERYYKKAILKNVLLDFNGKPTSGFTATTKPIIGDLALSKTHRAIVKAV